MTHPKFKHWLSNVMFHISRLPKRFCLMFQDREKTLLWRPQELTAEVLPWPLGLYWVQLELSWLVRQHDIDLRAIVWTAIHKNQLFCCLPLLFLSSHFISPPALTTACLITISLWHPPACYLTAESTEWSPASFNMKTARWPGASWLNFVSLPF